MSKRGGLGRGLAALIPTSAPPVEQSDSKPGTAPAGADREHPTEAVAGAGARETESERRVSRETSSTSGADEDHVSRETSGRSRADRRSEAGEAGDSADQAADLTAEPPARPAAGSGSAQVTSADVTSVDVTSADVDPDQHNDPTDAVVEQDLGPGIPGIALREIPLDSIEANPSQPRQIFDPDGMEELAHSIREFGMLQPIVVRPLDDGRYQLVMGERRWRAARIADRETVTAIVRATADEDLLRDALLENIHRVQLNPLEEAAAYEQLLSEFDVTQEQLATRIGRSRSQISNTIRLLRLPVPVQRRVAAGVLSAGHARAVLGLEGGPAQEAMATKIVAEGLSVRATEELVATATPGTERRPSRRARTFTAPGADALAERLSDAFDTRVLVQIGRRKGRIVVEFGSIDDLERIVALIQPDGSTPRT